MSNTSSGPAEPAEEQLPAEAQLTPLIFVPAAGFPPADLPTVFADVLLNIAPTPATVRFYFGRLDPEIGGGRSKNVPVAQIVMPAEGFVGMVLFFQDALHTLITNGMVPKELVDALREQISQTRREQPADK